MATPAKRIMDDLQFIGDELRDIGRFAEALDLDVLVEAANRAGHYVYTWDGVISAVRESMTKLTFQEDVRDLIEAALIRPRS